MLKLQDFGSIEDIQEEYLLEYYGIWQGILASDQIDVHDHIERQGEAEYTMVHFFVDTVDQLETNELSLVLSDLLERNKT